MQMITIAELASVPMSPGDPSLVGSENETNKLETNLVNHFTRNAAPDPSESLS
jgi:hypothetical protein